MPTKDLTPKAWLALVTVYIIWGSTYLAIAYVVDTMPPLLTASVRWLIAGSVMYAVGIRTGDRSDRPTRAHWLSAIVIGAALILGGNGLVSLGQQQGVASGTAGLLVATVPLWLALMDRVTFGSRLRPLGIAGLVVGFVGAGLLVKPPGSHEAVPLIGAFYVLAASAIWAGGSLYARGAVLPKRPVLATGMEMLAGAATLAIAGIARGELRQIELEHISTESILGLAYLAVFGSIVAFTAYTWLIRNARTSIVATYAYVNPLVAVLLGSVFRNEQLTLTTGIAGALIVASVAIIVTSGRASPYRRDESRDLSSERLPT